MKLSDMIIFVIVMLLTASFLAVVFYFFYMFIGLMYEWTGAQDWSQALQG